MKRIMVQIDHGVLSEIIIIKYLEVNYNHTHYQWCMLQFPLEFRIFVQISQNPHNIDRSKCEICLKGKERGDITKGDEDH